AQEKTARSWRLDTDLLAKPFSAIRKLMTPAPDAELVRRLMLAGYKKPAHADIFLGARLAVPAALGILVTLVVSSNVIFYFLLAVVLGFFFPDFWLSHAINKRREKLRLSLPDALDLLAICMEAGLGLDQGIVRVGQELHVSHQCLVKNFPKCNFSSPTAGHRLEGRKGLESGPFSK